MEDELKELQEKIGSAYSIMPVEQLYKINRDLTDLQAQNDELRAHAYRLANALVICNAQHKVNYVGGGLVREVLDETPAKSLADIRAEAVMSIMDMHWGEKGYIDLDDVVKYANKIKGCEL